MKHPEEPAPARLDPADPEPERFCSAVPALRWLGSRGPDAGVKGLKHERLFCENPCLDSAPPLPVVLVLDFLQDLRCFV